MVVRQVGLSIPVIMADFLIGILSYFSLFSCSSEEQENEEK